MTRFHRRLFIFADEWLGIALLLYLHRAQDPAFWWVFAAWMVTVYGLSYVPYWLDAPLDEADEAEK